jgi:hypothetical protein
MSRLPELRAAKPGFFARIVYFFARKKLGRVPEPLKVVHANGVLLAGLCAFETAMERSHRAPERLKLLASIKAALEVECPF